MNILFWTTCIFLLSIFLLQVFPFLRRFFPMIHFLKKRIHVYAIVRFLWVGVLLWIAFYYLYAVYLQYVLWRDGGVLTQYLVPPYQSISYVFSYHFMRLGIFYAISFLTSIAFFVATRRINKKYGEKFFEREEPYIGAFVIFLLGNPAWHYAWLLYLAWMFLIPVICSGFARIFLRRNERLSLYYFWIPIAFFVILIVRAYPNLVSLSF